ncbi:hypothetical protein PHMEG_00027046 [Phytophthora megakarya]|uniref:Uncharacterized protein n=1 Tax=Phytophthora megakarya TaxID=4795 RepID=A0A225VAQ8_9STRA|nr:hypothetical protein PHMEG_00027046 [Phytophthora megakarya]
MRCWSFHTVALASGTAEKEAAAKRELVNRLSEDASLANWTRGCSYRVVRRAELEELVQVRYAEELKATRREQKAEEEGEGDADEEKEDVVAVAVTPPLLALAFQRFVSQEKREFLQYQQTGEEDAQEKTEVVTGEENTQTPLRVYLLVDYPSSLPEIDALLRLGEVGSASQVTDGPEKLPLLPLIDGVVLVADLAARSRNKSGTRAVKQNSGNLVETSVFQTANTVVKAFYDASQVGGVEWSDFIFTNLDCCNPDTSVVKPSEDLEQELIATIEMIAAQKFSFKNWVGSTKFSVIPSFADNGEDGNDALYNTYESKLSGVFPSSIGVSTVLFAIADAVATTSGPPTTIPIVTCQNKQTDLFQIEEFLEHGDLIASRVADALLYHEALNAKGNPYLLPNGNHRIDDIERAIWRQSDLPGVGNDGRKAMPKAPELSEAERSVRNTELATFYMSQRFTSLTS